MTYRISCRTALAAVAVGLWTSLSVVGCAPEFSEEMCESNTDCFADETCSSQGICEPISEADTGVDGGGDVGDDTGDVAPAEVARITVEPESADIGLGLTLQLGVTAYDADDNEISDATFEWESTDETIVAVDTTGEVTAVSLGTATISVRSATNTEAEAFAEITVVEGEVATVDVTPASETLQVGATATFSATALNEAGEELSDRTINWSIGDDTIASIDNLGQVTALAAGTTTVVANIEGVEGTADLVVELVPVDRVVVDPTEATIAVGETVELTATAFDANDVELSNRDVTWASADDTIASVATDGVVTGVAEGTATITADIGGVTSSIDVEVVPANVAPAGTDQTLSTEEDTAIDVTLAGTDDDGDALTFAIATDPSNGALGTLDASTGVVTYTPAAGFTGQDSFTFTVSDGALTSAPATVTINVDPNDAPVATVDSVTLDEDAATTVDVLANDTDPEGDSLTATITTQPTNGSATVTSGGIEYTPDADYNGSDSLVYEAADGNGGADTATLTITVTAVDDAPVATDDATSTDEDTATTINVLVNDTDADNDALSIDAVTAPSNGTATVANNQVTYTPSADFNGTDTFDYVASDGNLTDTGTVTVTVNAVNDAPVANDDTATATVSTTITINVLDNDTDVDTADTLSVSAIDTTGTNATVVDNQDGTVDYTAPSTAGTDTFSYTVSDDTGATDTATVTVSVQ